MSDNEFDLQLEVPEEFEAVSKDSSLDGLPSTQDLDLILNAYMEMLQSMQPTRPEIIRGIPAFRVVQKAPQRWLQGKVNQLYACSEVTMPILGNCRLFFLLKE